MIDDVGRCLELDGLPFLDRFSRIVMAIILAERGRRDRARKLLAQQALETRNPGHPDYVRELTNELAVGSLDG